MFTIYLLLINLYAFIIYTSDKNSAIRKKWRTSEKYLLGLAIMGGSLGAYLSMKIFRHKTRKSMFAIGIPFLIVTQFSILFIF